MPAQVINRKKNVLMNVFLTTGSKILYLLIGFFVRKLLIQYIGVEYLGLTSLYSNILDLLNLAELGIGVAFRFRLFKPLVNEDKIRVSSILNIATKVYLIIGVLVAVVGGALSFVVPYLIKDSPVDSWYVILTYLISVVGIAGSYFCASRRLYFEANEQYFTVSLTELVIRCLISGTSIALVILGQSTLNIDIQTLYIIYLVLYSSQSFLINLTLTLFFTFKTKGFYRVGVDKQIQKEEGKIIRKNMKDVLPAKIGNYIFTSTDSIVISAFLGLTIVGQYSNYYFIFFNLLLLSILVSNALEGTFGKMVEEKADKEKLYKAITIYKNFQFCFSLITSVCMFVLANNFITMWVGGENIIPNLCVILLSFDYLIHSLYQPYSMMYVPSGQFRSDKICTLIAAGMNIITSIILVNFIGLPGVIIGTLVSNIFTFITRMNNIERKYFKKSLLFPAIDSLIKIAVTAGIGYGCGVLFKSIFGDNMTIVSFLLGALICIGICFVIISIYFIPFGYWKLIGNFLSKKKPFSIIARINSDLKCSRNIKRVKTKRHDKIKVVYICQLPHNFKKCEKILAKMVEDTSFECILYVTKDENGKSFDEYFNLVKKQYNVELVKDRTDLKSLEPNYVIYARPYNADYNENLRSDVVSKYSKIIVIPYGFIISKGIAHTTQNRDFFKNVSMFFGCNEDDYLHFKNKRIIGIMKHAQKGYSLGYPAIETAYEKIANNDSSKSSFTKNKKGFKVIYAPRWTNDSSAAGSNSFLNSYKELFDYFINNAEYSFVFRPHPMMLNYYIENGLFTKEFVDELFKRFEESSNSTLDTNPDYLSTFVDSDLFLAEYSSIVPEYYLTEKPIVYFDSSSDNTSDFAVMKKSMHIVSNANEAIKVIEDIKNGTDKFKADRATYKNEFLNKHIGSANRIVNAIKEDFKQSKHI